jgi:tRNA threonylcarbamoyladenosine biosynthesis protein TsaE
MKVRTVEEMRSLAAQFAREVMPQDRHATLVALSGDLGAGKTTFAQAVAKALGVEEDVTSPTFVIEKIYKLSGQKFDRLVHIDAYRLESPHEIEVLGFKELLRDPKNLILLEWPERVAGLLPEDAVKVRFDITGEERTISINGEEKDGTGS